MPKGYWIAHVTVNDPALYARYMEAAAVALKATSARFIVRAGRTQAVEGTPWQRNIVVEFASYEEALACYNAPEYQAAVAIRKACAESHFTVIEGYDG